MSDSLPDDMATIDINSSDDLENLKEPSFPNLLKRYHIFDSASLDQLPEPSLLSMYDSSPIQSDVSLYGSLFPSYQLNSPADDLFSIDGSEHHLCNMSSQEFNRYSISDVVIGAGTFGEIRKGFDKLHQEEVAIKIQNKTKMTEEARLLIRHECTILSELNHPNVIKIYGGYDDGEIIYWILPLLAGDLFHLMSKFQPMTEHSARSLFRQLAKAVAYCHSKDIIHRDIKLENVLIRTDCQQPSECTLVLTDFGFATRQTMYDPDLTEHPGSLHYAAPELIQGFPYRGRFVDVWAMGIFLYALTTGNFPYTGRNPDETIKRILYYPVPPIRGTKELEDLIRQMLTKYPIDRISSNKILTHPWMLL